MNKKLDIFSTLGHISKKNREFYRSLTEEERKALPPVVVARWLSGTSSKQQVVLLNEVVNPYVFALQKHKELLVDLMMVATSGKNQKYSWIKQQAATINMPKSSGVVSEYLKYSLSDAQEVLSLYTVEDVIEMAYELGYQTEDVTKIKKEWT